MESQTLRLTEDSPIDSLFGAACEVIRDALPGIPEDQKPDLSLGGWTDSYSQSDPQGRIRLLVAFINAGIAGQLKSCSEDQLLSLLERLKNEAAWFHHAVGTVWTPNIGD